MSEQTEIGKVDLLDYREALADLLYRSKHPGALAPLWLCLREDIRDEFLERAYQLLETFRSRERFGANSRMQNEARLRELPR